jgi:tricarballylate dehydrogenase
MSQKPDVVVVGAGNAALAAALTAHEAGAEVLVLERTPEDQRGGNSYFTGGLFRFPHYGLEDLCTLLPNLAEEAVANMEVEAYPESEFFEDVASLSRYRCDPELTEILVNRSRDAVSWLHSNGVRFMWSLGRHAFDVDGKFRFFGGAPLCVNGGGAGLMEALYVAAEKAGIAIQYGQRVVDLLPADEGGVGGVRISEGGRFRDIEAGSVVLACGGFASNTEWRARYLGPNWDLARVRGTKFNTGDGHSMALGFGARAFGHWSGCHATAWDANAPLDTDRSAGDSASRHSYPMGIVVNEECERFLDEGADFHTHTYAKYGAEILKQPGLMAYQIFDSQTLAYLRSDYREKNVSRAVADSIEGLADKLELDRGKLSRTVSAFNDAVGEGEFNPNILDGKRTNGLALDKTNWALRLDKPPYYGYAVTTGVTFTFGGLRINESGQVLDWGNEPISGLYAAGEIVGGIFHFNYPSGSGLTTGTVFGRIAGGSAAKASS